MVPEPLEYLFLLLVYFLLILLLFQEKLARVLKSRAFWWSFVLFAACWTLIEIYGLNRDMWIYSTERLCGIRGLGVPLEEYLVFFGIHLSTVLAWEAFGPAAEPRED